MPTSIPPGSRLTEPRLLSLYGTDWADYPAVWGAATTAPAIGNGSIIARWRKLGPTAVIVAGRILMGSTTTYGAGNWTLSLPMAAAQASIGSGSCFLYDQGTVANRKPGSAWLLNSTNLAFVGDTGDVNASAPFVWTNLDQLRFNFMYEVAS